MYVIYSIRQSSWVSKAGNYTSDLKEAKQFDHNEVLKQCIRHSYNQALDWFPVYFEDLSAVKALIK